MTMRDVPRNTVQAIRNLLRSRRRKGLDYVVLSLHGSYPEWSPPQYPLPFPLNFLLRFPPGVSLADMQAALKMLGDDRRVQGAVLHFGTFQAGLSTLYSLRRMLLDLRGKGKQLIAWLPTATTRDYYLACACDKVFIPPSGRVFIPGLRADALFLKNTLTLAGVEADFESIAEYKISPDTFRRSTMSEPHREMLDAILDSHFDHIVAAIAEGRGLDPERVRKLIDEMPLTAAEAVEAGLADAALYEDELAAHLQQPQLLAWQEALRWLRQPIQWTTRQQIGIVSLEGIIVPGRSRRFPIPAPAPLPLVEAQAGAETVVQALRHAETNERIAAVVFHVETPGGSALASDLIWREVRRLRERKPVVALMGRQATSGGYYVAASANRIVARPTTLTGSIGVWGGKLTLAGLYEKLGIGRARVQRGAMAGLYSEMTPFSDEERALVRRDMGETYARFKARVAEGRGMTDEQVEQIARGRVWTGAQAHEIGLVDELGDFETALALAKELAGLDPEREYTVMHVPPPRHVILPPPFPIARETETTWNNSLGAWIEGLQGLAREHVWALAPWLVQVRG